MTEADQLVRMALYELAKVAQAAHGLIEPETLSERQCADQLLEAIWKAEMALAASPIQPAIGSVAGGKVDA